MPMGAERCARDPWRMVNYRRARVQGGTYFLILTLRDRRSDALVRDIASLRDAWLAAKRRVPHDLIAVVVLPDHLHALARMRDARDDYSRLVQDVKKGFIRRIGMRGRGPWQSRFWEHLIRDDADLHAHIDYIHFNPVKHGHAACVADWPHSSFHRFVLAGILPRDWAS
jgi:putative transposase